MEKRIETDAELGLARSAAPRGTRLRVAANGGAASESDQPGAVQNAMRDCDPVCGGRRSCGDDFRAGEDRRCRRLRREGEVGVNRGDGPFGRQILRDCRLAAFTVVRARGTTGGRHRLVVVRLTATASLLAGRVTTHHRARCGHTRGSDGHERQQYGSAIVGENHIIDGGVRRTAVDCRSLSERQYLYVSVE